MVVHEEVPGGVRPEVTRGEAIEYARVELVSGEGSQISWVDASGLKVHVEPLTFHVQRMLGLDGVIEEEPVSVLFGSRRGVTAISEECEGVSQEGISKCARDKSLQRKC